MFEARLLSVATLKKIENAIKDLLNETTFDCTDSGIEINVMDKSHIALISLLLHSDGFDKYYCDRNLSFGIHLNSMAKILKCANNDDIVTMKAQDNADTITFIFESHQSQNHEKAEYEMKLINLDQDRLDIPEIDYSCTVCMPSMEFARICRNLAQFDESIVISCTEEGVKFAASGDIGSANTKLAQTLSTIDDEKEAVIIKLLHHHHHHHHQESPVVVTSTFASRYLNAFTKATPLSNQVQISMSAADKPLAVEYNFQDLGYIRYYLASKIEDD